MAAIWRRAPTDGSCRRGRQVVILLSPAARAYSWYQHQRAHGLQAALDHSFLEVITASNQSARPLRQLRNRCLEPGKYAAHLEGWLRFFPAEQLHLTDGERLRADPVTELHRLQDFIQVRRRPRAHARWLGWLGAVCGNGRCVTVYEVSVSEP